MGAPRKVTAKDYEAAVRRAAERGEPAPDDIGPPDDYEMSEDFRAWIVEAMRRHVMEQVQHTGLDRMAILKPDALAEDAEE